jgi:hypothetical protein
MHHNVYCIYTIAYLIWDIISLSNFQNEVANLVLLAFIIQSTLFIANFDITNFTI